MGSKKRDLMKPVNFYIFFLGLLLLGACGNPVEQPQPTGLTYSDENDLGNRIHEAMVSSTLFKILDRQGTYSAAYNYLSGLRVKLLATNLMDRRHDFDWEFHILEDDDVQDCFTTVGGKIYVTTGLLRDMVTNEAQVMGVLAHEMYYADNSYHMDFIKNNYEFTQILDVIYGGEEARALEMISIFYNSPRNANLVPQADQYAAAILCAIGNIRIDELGTVIENVSFTQPTPRWYSNHPTPSTSSIEDRKGELATKQFTCGNPQDVGFDRYTNFLNVLPPR